MEISPGPATRPGRGAARTALLVGLTAVLVVGSTLVARDRLDVPSSADLDRIEDAVAQGCEGSAEALADGTGYALDGTVVDVVDPPGRSPVRLTLRVREWFLGPPLGVVDVWADPTTVGRLDGRGPVEGTRLLVSGPGWGSVDDALVAAGCGRTRGWDAGTAADWRAALPRLGSAAPDGPVATYPSVGFTRSVTEPDLRGVVVVDSGCLYLQDGRTRWVPVLPSSTTAWRDRPPAVTLAGVTTDVGHVVRLAGASATARPVGPVGVPDDCDPAAPRFVVAEHGGTGAAPTQEAGTATVTLASDAARRAGLRPTGATGGVVTDTFGARSSRVALRTEGGDVLVHVASLALPTWPHAYAPQDADLVWSGDPDGAAGLPAVPPGAELAVVTRSDDVTQVLLRTPGRVVVSVTADLTTLAVPEDVALQALTDMAVDVAVDVAALSPGGDGS